MTEQVIDVWAVRLHASAAAQSAYRSFLTPAESARAARFNTDRLRHLYELSQGNLRLLLAHRLACPLHEIQLTSGHNGKPALAGDSNLRFNKSDAGDLALYAFTTDCDLGVDLEQITELPDLEQVAHQHFSPEETHELLALADPGQRRDAFYRCWTRKEAYVKAVGGGLSIPLDQFQVAFIPGADARFIRIGNDPAAASAWQLHALEPAPGYVGALAYEAATRPVRLHPPIDCNALLNALAPPPALSPSSA
jgi:4'-phosphopantetheinyl transferase